MNIAIGQIQIQPENLRHHAAQIQEIICQGKNNQVDILIFPAFSTTGYLPGETSLFPDFYADCQDINEKIATLAEGITLIWGGILYQAGQVIPTIFLAEKGNITHTLPYSQGNTVWQLTANGKLLSLVCTWDTPTETKTQSQHDQLQLVFYAHPGTAIAAAHQAHTVEKQSTSTLYLNHGGVAYEGKQVFVLPGYSSYHTAHSKEQFTTPFGETGLYPLTSLTPAPKNAVSKSAHIYRQTVYGIRSLMASSGLKKAVIGLSGGIDSALNACLYSQAIGAENVLLINMPSRHNAQRTRNLAKQLSRDLGCFYGVFPIEESVSSTIQQLEHTPLTCGEAEQKLTISSLTAENIQARDRGSRLLTAIAQSCGGVFTANCNKTEIAVGYATMYGDQAGFLAATGNLWKYEVYALARYMDEAIYQKPILAEIIRLKPSAELSPAQDITKGLGDPLIYEYHDKLFSAWEDRETPLPLEDILTHYQQKTLGEAIGCEESLIESHFPTAAQFISDLEKWWQAYQGMANVKRLQSPPILIVHNPPKSCQQYRPHRPYFSEEYLKRKADLLK